MKVLFTFTLVIAAALAQIPGDLYDGCYSGDKYCFGSPEGCVDAGACTLFSSYVTADEASWDFEIYANWDHVNPDIYAAIGFSAGDTEMGDDLVIMCNSAGGDVGGLGIYWNIEITHENKRPYPVDPASAWEGDFELVGDVATSATELYCKVRRNTASVDYIVNGPEGPVNAPNTLPGSYHWLVSSGNWTTEANFHAAADASFDSYLFDIDGTIE